jgi:hypothetical protein
VEFKIVVNFKDGRAVVGVSAPDSDPVFGTVEGDMPKVLSGAMDLLAVAQEKWKTQKRNPAANLPKPAPVPATTTTPSAKPVPAAQSVKSKIQESLF